MMSNSPPQPTSITRFYNLLLATSVMVFLLIVMGGIVRVTGSGLGCPDWPKCFGQWVPPMRLDAIIEYLHRLIATLTSPLILASAVIGWRRFRQYKIIYQPLIWSVVLLGFQGLLGGIVVILETPPNLVAVHLGNALIIFALILVPTAFAYSLKQDPTIDKNLALKTKFSKLSIWVTATIFIVLITGAIVAGGNATESCPGWPLCNGVLFPNHLPGWIHMTHRFFVAAASILVIYLGYTVKNNPSNSKQINEVTWWTVALFFSQALIGAIKVTTNFPMLMLGLHVVNAAAVWSAVVILVTLTGINTSNE